jgi:hypothetical protein
MASILVPAIPVTGPWLIDRNDCIGDSLPFINANTNLFTTNIKSLSTLLLTLSSLNRGLSGIVTPTINLTYNNNLNTLSAEVINGSINTTKLGGDILQTGKALLTSASLSSLVDVSFSTLANQQALVWNDSTKRWENQSVATGGSPLTDGNKGDITVSNGGLLWTLQTATGLEAVQTTNIRTGAVTPAKLSTGAPAWSVSGILTATGFNGPLTGNVTGTANNVTGVVAVSNGGTGATTIENARTNLSVAAASHTHGNITNAGAIGSTTGLPIITTTSGVLTTGSFGTAAGTFCQGNDVRLSDARTPTSHTHGNITNAGAIGSTTGLPIITTTSGVLTTGSFGTAAGTFCQGNDVRLSNARQATNTATQVTSLGVGTAASATTGEIRATNDITAFYVSDINLKENIKPINNSLEKIQKINGVEFDWKQNYIESRGGEDEYFVRKHDVGVIAQEIQAVLPEVVGKRQDGTLAVKYDHIVPLLIEAIKELTERVKYLELNK